MAERELIVDKERIAYEGPFSVAELYRLIEEFFIDKGYDRRELRHVESVKAEGKSVELDLEPWKLLSDYAKSLMRIRILMTGLKELSVEVDGAKKKVNEGKLQIVFDGYVETDYEGKWETKPIFVFLRTIYDKYIYKTLTGGYGQTVKNDVLQLKRHIEGFLNLQKYGMARV